MKIKVRSLSKTQMEVMIGLIFFPEDKIIRYPGGFWTLSSWKFNHRKPTAWSIGTRTVMAMMRKGILEMSKSDEYQLTKEGRSALEWLQTQIILPMQVAKELNPELMQAIKEARRR